MDRSEVRAAPPATERIKLAALVIVSLALTATANRVIGKALLAHASPYAWLATAAVPSVVVITCLYWLLGEPNALRWPSLAALGKSGAFRLAAIWLSAWVAGLGLAAVLTGHWITYAQGTSPLLAFLLFGPMGEELLFRGLVFERARRSWPAKATPAILLSTAAFSAHHLWLQAAPDGFLVAQVLFTIPMGIVLATLRERTSSLWPGLLLHMTTNLPAVF